MSIKNSLYNISEQSIRLLSGLALAILIARYLGPREYGVYSYCVAIVAMLTPVAKLGLDSVIVKAIVLNPKSEGNLVRAALLLRVCTSLIVILSTALIWAMNPDERIWQYVLIISIGLVFQSADVIESRMQANGKFSRIARCKLIQLAISTLFKFGLLAINAELIWFVWATVLDQFLLFGTYLIADLNDLKLHEILTAKLFEVGRMIRQGFPVLLSSTLVMVQARLDQIMLMEMVGDYDVGIYNSALRVIEAVAFVPVVVVSVYFPRIVKAKVDDEIEYQRERVKLYRLMMAVFLIIASPFIVFNREIIDIAYGIKFSAAAGLLPLMAIRLLFAGYGMARNSYLINENLSYYAFLSALIGLGVNFALNIYLIQMYGCMGAVISSIVSLFVTVFGVDLMYKATRDNCKKMLYSVIFK